METSKPTFKSTSWKYQVRATEDLGWDLMGSLYLHQIELSDRKIWIDQKSLQEMVTY